MKRRVVITSIGVISSLGDNLEEINKSIENNQTSFQTSEFDSELLVAPHKKFNLKEIVGRSKDLRYLPRGAQFALAAATLARENSSLNHDLVERAGLIVGGAPNLDFDGEFPEIKDEQINYDKASALFILRFLPNTVTSVISKSLGIHGENLTLNTACASSLQAVGEAFRKIKAGYLEHAFAGGGDSRISNGGLLAYKKANALFKIDEQSQREYVPFNQERFGFVPGEGGAVFLLEELEHAKSRGATIYAEIKGYGASLDGYKLTAPEPTGKYAFQAVNSALKEAELNKEDIELISAHGTGTALNDAMEAEMLAENFGSAPGIVAFKSWVGHLSAACGAMELALLLNCFQTDSLPGIRGLKAACNSKLNFVKKREQFFGRRAILENFGFGGQNSALVVEKWQD